MTLSSTDQQEEDSEGGISRLRASGEPVLLFPKSPLPRAVTFVQIQKTWVIDPTESEESLASASVTLLLCQRDSQQKLEGVQLKGGPVSFEELESLMDAVQCRA